MLLEQSPEDMRERSKKGKGKDAPNLTESEKKSYQIFDKCIADVAKAASGPKDWRAEYETVKSDKAMFFALNNSLLRELDGDDEQPGLRAKVKSMALELEKLKSQSGNQEVIGGIGEGADASKITPSDPKGKGKAPMGAGPSTLNPPRVDNSGQAVEIARLNRELAAEKAKYQTLHKEMKEYVTDFRLRIPQDKINEMEGIMVEMIRGAEGGTEFLANVDEGRWVYWWDGVPVALKCAIAYVDWAKAKVEYLTKQKSFWMGEASRNAKKATESEKTVLELMDLIRRMKEKLG